MKKIILTIAALTCVGYSSMAQNMADTSREKVQFGFKVGLNYSNVYDTQGEEFKADGRFGFVGGAFVAIPIGKYLGIQPEILFAQRGFQATGVVLAGKYDFTRTTSHIDIPLLVAIKPVRFITILAGPQYSYMLQRKDVFANGLTTVTQEQEFAKDNIRENTLCFTGGVDVNLSNIVVSARAGWDLQNNHSDGNSTTPRYKNAWYQATIGYRF